MLFNFRSMNIANRPIINHLTFTKYYFIKRNLKLHSFICLKNKAPKELSKDFENDQTNVAQLLKTMKINNTKLNLAKPAINKTAKFLCESKQVQSASNDLSPPFTSATDDIVKKLPNEHKNEIKKNLISKLRESSLITNARKSTFDLSLICAGMKIDRQARRSNPKEKKLEKSPNHNDLLLNDLLGDRAYLLSKKPRTHRKIDLSDGLFNEEILEYSSDDNILALYEGLGDLRQKIDLFGAPLLNIFQTLPNRPENIKESPNLWGNLEMKELSNHARQPPLNAYEEMIQMTNEGKLWKFPIDNERGLEEETQIPFYDHVFITNYVEDQLKNLPTDDVLNSPAIKHFLELVAVGLSKNPYYTVNEKREFIAWYFAYFKQHESIIKASYQDAEDGPDKPDSMTSAYHNSTSQIVASN